MNAGRRPVDARRDAPLLNARTQLRIAGIRRVDTVEHERLAFYERLRERFARDQLSARELALQQRYRKEHVVLG